MVSVAENVGGFVQQYLPLLQDALSPVTRSTRRLLLVLSTVGVAVVKAGLVPSKIPAFGLTLDVTSQAALLWVVTWVVGYLLAAFLLYGLSDFSARMALVKAVDAGLKGEQTSHELLVHESQKGPVFAVESGSHEKEKHERLEQSRRSVLGLIAGIDEFRKSARVIWALRMAIVRAAWDVVLPILWGLYATVLLWSKATGA